MESPQLQPTSPTLATGTGGPLKSSSSSTRVVDDVTILTSFNPFSEEDEHESSYTLVSSLFSRVKNSFAAPLSSAVAAASGTPSSNVRESVPPIEQKRTPIASHPVQSLSPVMKPVGDKFRPKIASASGPSLAPPLVSVVPARPETPIFNSDYERQTGRGGLLYSPAAESQEGGLFGTVIPGFPIQDDARSIHTAASFKRSASVSKVIRRIRGEGLSRDYWMDDETCKECYDCKSVFTAWRRKHHCRICGQIFCSRCASNIIKGSRFGVEGMLRVCNLCLEKLNYDDDNDDDDRRSVISNLSSSWPHPAVDHYLQSLGHHSQSPFAASQLFGRTDEPYSLYSIAETKRHLSGSEGGGFGSRPLTPSGDLESSYWEDSEGAQPAPFRRTVTDEDKEPLPDSDPFPPDQSPTGPRSANKTPDLRASSPSQIVGTKSSIQFPGGSPDLGSHSPNMSRSRVNSYAETEVQTPFLRSRVHSRLNELAMGEAGWRTRRESTAYAQELNAISMFHLRIMLRQMLTTEGISNVREWEETLLKLALRIARDLTFTAYPYREGADMDVRRYVKIKKIPGGCPRDSEYVDGAVITKNVAHKQMPRSQKNPRLMLVTFPLEFQRVEGQYMHFGQIVRQEKEYLTNLVSRIAALRPHVVLAEKSVSRLALEELVKQRIAVARTVKESAIKLVARMTQGDIFSSIDKLALEPRLGHCANYRVQTFDHPLIPCRRKSYMRFEGCSRDLGCTIILRGGDVDHLRRVKKVTLFLAFIVRNLKLETHLWKDSVITAPHLTADAAPPAFLVNNSSVSVIPRISHASRPDVHDPVNIPSLDEAESTSSYEELPSEELKSLELSSRIRGSLEPYLKTFISVSATLRFPPPYPIWRMQELDDELQRARRAWEDEIIRSEEKPSAPRHMKDETVTASSSEAITTTEDIKAQIEALPSPGLPESPGTDDKSPSTSDGCTSTLSTDYFARKLTSSPSYSSLRPATAVSARDQHLLEKSEQVSLVDDNCIAAQSAYDLVKWQHDEQRRVWEWYLRKNKDDFVVDKYQFITVMEFTLPIDELSSHRACDLPELRHMTFYGKDDCTLGQFIEKAIHDNLVQFLDPKAICSGKGCDEPLARHCRVFVNNESRLVVYVEHWDGQIKTRLNTAPSPELITTWSACRVCGSATPFIPVSEEMQRYSFAKFLELHFYPADVQLVQGAGCIHNIYQHHIRYFAMRGMTVMFQTDPITLCEIIYPPGRIHIRKETLYNLKNEDYETLLRKNAQWYSALVNDLNLINQDAATGDEETDAAVAVNISRLIERAINERIEMAELIQEVYKNTSPIDTLALNRVRAERQDKIVAWEADFDKLPKPKISQLTDKDRKVTALGTVRAMWPRRYDLPGVLENLHLPPASVSESVSESEEAPTSGSRTASELHTSTESVTDTSDVDNTSTEMGSRGQVATSSTTDEEETPTVAESGSDSDSTIAAVTREPGLENAIVDLDNDIRHRLCAGEPEAEQEPPVSKLPRRSGQHPSVAELVKRYQDYLPPSVSTELATTSFPASAQFGVESDQETPTARRQPRPRVKGKPKILKRKESVSDFEHGYAANVAPRYLAPGKTIVVHQSSRIPGPATSIDSRDSSRRPSPDKRPSYLKRDAESTLRGGRASSPPSRALGGLAGRSTRSGVPNRNAKDRSQPTRIGSMSNVRNAIRKASNTNFGGKVSNIARQFERMNKDIERVTRRYAVIRGRRARPVASSRATVEVFDSVRDAIKDASDASGESSSEGDDEGDDEDDGPLVRKEVKNTGLPSEPEQPKDSHGETHPDRKAPSDEQPTSSPDADGTVSPAPTPAPPVEAQAVPETMPSPLLQGQTRTPLETPSLSDVETSSSAPERPSTIMKALSGFWPNHLRGHFDFEADDPMADPEHIFRESSMVVRTDEPTSIIALALNSPQYRDMLAKSRAEKRLVKEPKVCDGEEAFMPDDCSVTDANSTWGVVNVDSGDDANPTEDLRVPSSKLPWAISFESGDITIACTILYPEQFDALRRTYDCEKSMIESLARCVKWNASGGKSGSAFLKTRDDRFIAKELSRSELETMATFGPAYFDYMSSAVTANRPTLLARVFGCYKLVFRKKSANEKSSRSKSTQMNLLVMENLFYDKRFAKIYDLKGSTRNRHVHATGRENEVLLDENLMQTAHLSPFYVREHAKRLFRGALYNDTKFLADINVMDYSLVVGVDSVKNELVVGIVDYIRTYTWDKKLESWVKESTFLAGAGKGEPTIITPKQYRQRFLSAMERYFPLVPDRWMKHMDNPEDEYNGLQDFWPDW